jgi:hypothetical protein
MLFIVVFFKKQGKQGMDGFQKSGVQRQRFTKQLFRFRMPFRF